MRPIIVDLLHKLCKLLLLHRLVEAELVNELLIRNRLALVLLVKDVVDLPARGKKLIFPFLLVLNAFGRVGNSHKEVPVINCTVPIQIHRLDDLLSSIDGNLKLFLRPVLID